MKLGEVVFAAVYKDGDIAEGHEDIAMGTMRAVDLTIQSTTSLREDLKKGLITIKKVKVVLVP
jgi:hypothetical protein